MTALIVDELILEITHELKVTTVVVTHDINSMMTIGEFIIFLTNGNITWEGSMKNIFNANEPNFEKIFYFRIN